jgi:hypothetical protein
MHAELDGLICSGPRVGKQFTYALLEERVPPAKALPRADALATLTQRYFATRGPATAQDFAMWSGLTMTDAKAGIASLGKDFAQEKIAGRDYYFSAGEPTGPTKPSATFLMPDYDEYGLGYVDRSALFTAAGTGAWQRRTVTIFDRMVIVDGRIAGSWRRTEAADRVVVEVVMFAPLAKGQQRALAQAVQRYGEFLRKEATLRLS